MAPLWARIFLLFLFFIAGAVILTMIIGYTGFLGTIFLILANNLLLNFGEK